MIETSMISGNNFSVRADKAGVDAALDGIGNEVCLVYGLHGGLGNL
jgi:hypothetical protein